jgi:hypothetical protein
MATRALDVVTVFHALITLGDRIGAKRWDAVNDEQARVLAMLDTHRESIARITGLDALASNLYQELNKFLTDRKFAPMVDPFDPSDNIGVVSVLDKLVKWLSGPGEVIEIPSANGKLPGFKLPAQGVRVYSVAGYDESYLVELLTKSHDTLWLFTNPDQTLDGLDLVRLSMEVMSRRRAIASLGRMGGGTPRFAGAQIPMVDFDIHPDLGWLLGACATTEKQGAWTIVQAKQQFKMRMDETGARVKVATALVGFRCAIPRSVPFVVDRPFYGWWTQKGIDLPMAAFFADWDSLKKPAGSLEDL